MSLLDVLRHSVRPDRLAVYQDQIRLLAERARKRKDAFHWIAFETAIGDVDEIGFAAPAESWKEIETRGTSQEMVLRVLGEKEGQSWLEETTACLVSATRTVAVDRPDLSYTREPQIRAPFVQLTAVRVRPGEQESFEEFVRKLAEAIPKVDDTVQLATRQMVVGDLREYIVVSPLEQLARLDDRLPPDQLLTQAFGAAEGGLLYRAGMNAIEHVERRVLGLRQDLSHPAG